MEGIMLVSGEHYVGLVSRSLVRPAGWSDGRLLCRFLRDAAGVFGALAESRVAGSGRPWTLSGRLGRSELVDGRSAVVLDRAYRTFDRADMLGTVDLVAVMEMVDAAIGTLHAAGFEVRWDDAGGYDIGPSAVAACALTVGRRPERQADGSIGWRAFTADGRAHVLTVDEGWSWYYVYPSVWALASDPESAELVASSEDFTPELVAEAFVDGATD
jgi:hypothetical protein